MKIFLSYSTQDKAIVKRINSDLKSHGFETWLDSEQIDVGSPIVDAIETGLTQSEIFIIFLSRTSVLSRWVKNEFQTQFYKYMTNNNIKILPVLINDCKMPEFLLQFKYIDFRKKEDYESNLSALLNTLVKIKTEKEQLFKNPKKANSELHHYSILENTREMLEDLKNEYISLPVHKRLLIVDTLKKGNYILL